MAELSCEKGLKAMILLTIMIIGANLIFYQRNRAQPLVIHNSTKNNRTSPMITFARYFLNSSTTAHQELKYPYEITNRKWVQRIRDYCNSSETKPYINPNNQYVGCGVHRWVWMASKKHKLFYCSVPKSASTMWKTYLLNDIGEPWRGDPHM